MIMLIIATRKQTEHKNFENNFDLSSESEIKPQQRTCVCLDRIALLQNFMNRDSPKERQQVRLNKKKNLIIFLYLSSYGALSIILKQYAGRVSPRTY